MSWLQLSLVADRDDAPLIEMALENGGALAVTVDDAGDDPILEPDPGATPLWRRVRITALFENDAQGEMLARAAAERLGGHSLEPPLTTTLDDRPWERVWLDDFEPTCFGERLWICPQGQRPPAVSVDTRAVFVDLDPGLAFGTGHHPTTALCLRWLDGLDLRGKTVLDFGCGSGILAIAALKLGAATAIAVDHDAQALEATFDNACANGVSERLIVEHPDRRTHRPADVVVANILAGPLIELAPTLIAAGTPNALLGLSGILAHQAERVAAAYSEQFALQPPEVLEDWALLSGVRRSGP
jgi:ribosomal protein L11 methyltransferase